MDEEWRVSLVIRTQPARGKTISARDVRRLLSRHLGEEVSVSAGKAGVYLYAATADAAAAAEGVAREVLALKRLTADIQLERWDPSRQAWLPGGAAAVELPAGDPGRRRGRAAWAVIAAILEGMGNGGF